MASILKSPHTVALYSKSTRALTSQIFLGGQASKAWRSKDKAVANRIGSVLMSKADSYDVLLGVCIELCPMASSDDEDEDEYEELA